MRKKLKQPAVSPYRKETEISEIKQNAENIPKGPMEKRRQITS